MLNQLLDSGAAKDKALVARRRQPSHPSLHNPLLPGEVRQARRARTTERRRLVHDRRDASLVGVMMAESDTVPEAIQRWYDYTMESSISEDKAST